MKRECVIKAHLGLRFFCIFCHIPLEHTASHGKLVIPMKNLCLSFLLILLSVPGFARHTDSTFYEEGTLRTVQTYEEETPLFGADYTSMGVMKHRWDYRTGVLVSFNTINLDDTLINDFQETVPRYTLYQHYGPGPLMEIETYVENVRHGPTISYDRDGCLNREGQFTQWEKTGIWTYYDDLERPDRRIHWFHPHYNQRGISLDNVVIPIGGSLLFFGVLLGFVSLLDSYRTAFYFAGGIALGTVNQWLVEALFFRDAPLLFFQPNIQSYMPALLPTLMGILTLLSLITLFFHKKKGIELGVIGGFLIFGLIMFSLLQLTALLVGIGGVFG